jgi:hypothetical protein
MYGECSCTHLQWQAVGYGERWRTSNVLLSEREVKSRTSASNYCRVLRMLVPRCLTFRPQVNLYYKRSSSKLTESFFSFKKFILVIKNPLEFLKIH